MFPSDVIAKEQFADRVRRAESERRSRPLAEARAPARRRRVWAELSAVWATVVPRRRRASVPSVDDRFQLCLGRRGAAQTECWAELDQYLTTEVVTWIPYLNMEHTQVVSERVVAYYFDQFGALPALDRIALAPGSE
jgi:hypothetical protein